MSSAVKVDGDGGEKLAIAGSATDGDRWLSLQLLRRTAQCVACDAYLDDAGFFEGAVGTILRERLERTGGELD